MNGQTYPRNSVMDTSGVSLVFDYKLTDKVGAKLILAQRGYDSEWTNDSDRTPFGITQTHYIQNHDEDQAELQFNGTARQRTTVSAGPPGLFYFTSDSRAYNTTEFEAFNYTGALANFVANDLYTTDNSRRSCTSPTTSPSACAYQAVSRTRAKTRPTSFDHGPALNRSDVPLMFGDDRTDWKVSVDYSLNENVFLYVQAATGFTSEGATPRIFTVGQLMALQGRRARQRRDRREARVPRQPPAG